MAGKQKTFPSANGTILQNSVPRQKCWCMNALPCSLRNPFFSKTGRILGISSLNVLLLIFCSHYHHPPQGAVSSSRDPWSPSIKQGQDELFCHNFPSHPDEDITPREQLQTQREKKKKALSVAVAAIPNLAAAAEGMELYSINYSWNQRLNTYCVKLLCRS